MPDPSDRNNPAVKWVLFLFFLSGLAGLTFEILWMRELHLLFGNTTYAAATTWTTFFLGMAAGNAFWGKQLPRHHNPLRLYGILELATAVSASLLFILEPVTLHCLGKFLTWDIHQPLTFLIVKIFLAGLFLFPPAFFMGGTLPAICHLLIPSRQSMGRTASFVYSINTWGGAFGIFITGFFLLHHLGYWQTYWLTIILAGWVGVTAISMSHKYTFVFSSPLSTKQDTKSTEDTPCFSLSWIRVLAFLSGFGVLVSEVGFTHMLSQVLHNSTYTFSCILLIFIGSMGFGGFIAHNLTRRHLNPVQVIGTLTALIGILIATAPVWFHRITDGMLYLGSGESFIPYLGKVSILVLVVMALPVIIQSILFPYLWKISEDTTQEVGPTIGHLTALNTCGALLGSLFCGFILIPLLGLWNIFLCTGMMYACLALGTFLFRQDSLSQPSYWWTAPIGSIVIVGLLFNPLKLPKVTLDASTSTEELLDLREGSQGIVAVIRNQDTLKIRVNNSYTLGSTAARACEQMQTDLPLSIHESPRSIFFLGLGTGITAGASLNYPLGRILVCENNLDAVHLARKHFQPWQNNLFFDPRATILIEDGRHYLSTTQELFDIIIADLFIPWRAGIGNLYTREMFQTGRKRLTKKGIYVQWIPLYQVSLAEFKILARTMQDVFPQVTVWRGDFATERPILALVGHSSLEPLATRVLEKELSQSRENPDTPVLYYYIGNLEALQKDLEKIPLNTDNKPIIEFQAPITHRKVRSGQTSWLHRKHYLSLMKKFQSRIPPNQDPYLALASSTHHGWVTYAHEYHTNQ